MKAEVAQISGVKSLLKHDNTQLQKQELVIRDTASSMQLVLWNDYVESLELHKTYILTNLRLKDSKFGWYVNIPKSQEFTFEESTPFSGPLAQLEDNIQQLTTSTLLGKIIGVQSATRNLLCISSVQKPGSKVAICQGQGCKLMQKVSSCKCNWHVKLLFETEDLKKIRLTIFNNQCLQKLLNVEMFT